MTAQEQKLRFPYHMCREECTEDQHQGVADNAAGPDPNNCMILLDTCSLCLLSIDNNRYKHLRQKRYGPQNLKHVLYKKFADTRLTRSGEAEIEWLYEDLQDLLELTPKRGLSIIGATIAAKSLQSYPTLCNPIDRSPSGYPVPGILQTRTLEWVAISFSNAK